MDVFRGWWRNAFFVFWWVLALVATTSLAHGVALLVYPLVALVVIGVLRSIRCAVIVKPNGLTIRKVWSTHQLAREQVAGLDCYYNWLARTENCLAVRLTSGGLVKTLSVPAAQSLFGELSKPTVGVEELEVRLNAVFGKGSRLSA
ncbi:MAG TPA: hypothetical protein VIM47_09480 [Dermatophilaceae bacterium]